MNSNSERFEKAYNQVHAFLKRMNPDYKNAKGFQDFAGLLKEDKSFLIQKSRDKLSKYHDLRNIIIHEKGVEASYIAEPHLDVVEQIEKIAETVTNPPKALSISSKTVKWVSLDYPIQEVLRLMENAEQDELSQIPVYQDKKCLGMITHSGISRWLIQHLNEEHVSLKNIKVKDVLPLEDMDHVLFVNKQTNVFEVEFLFKQQLVRKNPNLQAVIITENGSKEQLPLGIITAWDLIKI